MEQCADLLLTSPPYADAIDYSLSQRLSLYLLGYKDKEIGAFVASEIGARRKRFMSSSRTSWSDELVGAIKRQAAGVKDEGTICLVLPHKDSGRSNGEENIKAALEAMGWSIVFERDRSIHQSHTRQSWTSIKQETIIVFVRKDRT
jgi:DNA modification methylase